MAPKNKTLRAYQAAGVRYLERYLLDDTCLEALLTAPPGAGKSLMIQALAEMTLATEGFHSALIITPQEQIEEGFFPENGGLQITFPLPDPLEGAPVKRVSVCKPLSVLRSEHPGGKWTRLREDDESTCPRARTWLRRKNLTAAQVLLSTHAAATLWLKSAGFFPKGRNALKGYLLVVDEAHHASEKNQMGDFVQKWKERGGTVLHVTATPFRNDADDLFEASIPRWTWTMAAHSKAGYAPKDLQIRSYMLGLQADTEDQMFGLEVGQGSVRKSCQEIVDRWIKDKKPKAGVIVPPNDSDKWREELVRQFKKAGARVLDGTGPDGQVKKDFKATLKTEREEVKDFRDSKVDVIIACKRFNEGTDWALCSHVYVVGMPRSFNLILQQWGRTMRDKTLFQNYPKKHAQTAQITFMVPHLSRRGQEKFGDRHGDYAALLSCFMVDVDTASLYKGFMEKLAETHRVHGERGKRDGEIIEAIAQEIFRCLETETSSKAIYLSAQAQAALEVAGREPTLENVVEWVNEAGCRNSEISAADIEEVKQLWEREAFVHNSSAGDYATLVNRIKRRLNGEGPCPPSIIQAELRKYMDETKDAFKDHILADHRDGIYTKLADLRGETVEEIARDLRERSHKATMPEIFGAMRACLAEKGKDWLAEAIERGWDASPWLKRGATWNELDKVWRDNEDIAYEIMKRWKEEGR